MPHFQIADYYNFILTF